MIKMMNVDIMCELLNLLWCHESLLKLKPNCVWTAKIAMVPWVFAQTHPFYIQISSFALNHVLHNIHNKHKVLRFKLKHK